MVGPSLKANPEGWDLIPPVSFAQSPSYTACSGIKIFGGVGKFETVQSISRTYSLPTHSYISISIIIYLIGDWSGDSLRVSIDDTVQNIISEGAKTATCTPLSTPAFETPALEYVLLDHTSPTITLKIEKTNGLTGAFGIRRIIIETRIVILVA
jgi:hypothetical protein